MEHICSFGCLQNPPENIRTLNCKNLKSLIYPNIYTNDFSPQKDSPHNMFIQILALKLVHIFNLFYLSVFVVCYVLLL